MHFPSLSMRVTERLSRLLKPRAKIHPGIATLTRSQGIYMLQKSKNFDFEIECNGFNFNVHQDILAAKSKFFASCLDGHFKVSPHSVL